MEEDQRLLERILDGKEKPADLSLALLQKITCDFSKERKIGHGGFGAVYKGVLGERNVAVKRIYVNLEKMDDDDKQFGREFTSLWNTNHQNVVRFLGFCSNIHQKWIEKDGSGEMIWADMRQRLFCFEYISNGSLNKHITDELRGLEWETRYEIITGICEGLRYLHEEKKIIHMDLKPANILLDHQDKKYMVPKLTDFGLSRPNENLHTVGTRYGTRGYMAPEYEKYGETTFMSDIYSLGAIIMELATGGMEVPDKHNVLRRWRHRWNNPPTPLQYQQVTGCIDIAVRCREEKPEARPSIKEIIDLLNESTNGHTGQEISTYMDDDMLGIEPLELHFNKEMSWSVKLTNKTKAYFAFKIGPSNQYTMGPHKGIVPPECDKYLVQITLQSQERAPQVTHNADKFVVQSTIVSNGLINITEDIFRAEDGKVVDEVNLMVIYGPAKPLKNSRSREDTNMPAEEAPEAKKRRIVESASGKGKNKIGTSENAEAASMDIGSSEEEIEQCNFHTLQSFSRHYPTNKTYLGEESDRAVDSARGAMGSLLDKLGKLVTQDYSLDTSIKSDIESFSLQLMKIHLDLPQLKNVVRAKLFLDEVRELSYNIEDMVDVFLVHVEPDSSRSGFKELTEEGLKLLVNGRPTHHLIDDVIKDINKKVQAVVHRKEEYNFDVKDVVVNATTKATTNLWISAIYEHEEWLVGIKTPRDALIRLLQDDGDASKKELKIISIVGMGGLGKTTLAKTVYDKLKGYHPKAFISVGQNPNVETVLKKIIRKCQEDFKTKNLDVDDLIEKLRQLLEDKRYIIVIDDIWDSTAWKLIYSAFPRNKRGSIMITTTRIMSVARATCNAKSEYVYEIKPLSKEDSRKLFLRRTFGREIHSPDTPIKENISKYILKTCGGMPLAINSIASLLAGEPDSTWENVRKSLGALTEGKTERKTDIDNMKQILDLSYTYLPDDLKTCLLYVCNYPEDREIDKNDLLRQWIAEGFVSRKGHLDAEDVAEDNFKALINMCMIEPGKTDYNNEVLSCRVHDIIVDLMRSKSSEVNFIQVIDGSKDVSGQLRRVSIQYNDKEDSRILERIKGSLSHARSVSLYGGSLVPYFLKFKYVRVLHIEDKEFSRGLDLTGISRLFLLRYLKVALNYEELKLPDQIGQLQQLETIDIQDGGLRNYPSDIVTLPRLSHLRYVGYGGIALPDGINRLKSLRTLEGVCLYKSSVGNLKGLGELTNLTKLQIYSMNTSIPQAQIGLIAVNQNAMCSSISRLSTSLRILIFGDIADEMLDFTSWSRPIFPGGSHIQKLDMSYCIFQRCPQWIGQLNHLYSFTITVREVADGLTIVSSLPSLAYFHLFNCSEEKEESLVIPGGGAFQVLKHLIFHSKKTRLTFEERALPKLEKLGMQFPYHNTHQFLPVRIEHLPSPNLKEITLSVADHFEVEGSEDMDDDEWERYCRSDAYLGTIRQHKTTVSSLLKRAFKAHHPGTHILIRFESGAGNHDEAEYESGEAVDETCELRAGPPPG